MSLKIRLGSVVNVACEEGDFPAEIVAIRASDRVVDVVLVSVSDNDAGFERTEDILDNVPFASLRRFDRPGPVDDPPITPYVRKDLGFNQYMVKWVNTSFKFSTIDPAAEFYGHWRKTVFKPTNIPGYAIDMWAHHLGRDFAVESVLYTDDPRLDMRSLEGDLCAMANKFLFGRLSGNLDTLDDLIKRAKQPRVEIKNLQTLDTLLIRLKEIRDTAIACGGTRYLAIPHDTPDPNGEVPEVTLQINLTREAILYKDSRAPAVDYGKSYLSAEGIRGHIKSDPKTIRALIEKLRGTKDPTEARRLRSLLRKMGHSGGSRFMPEESE